MTATARGQRCRTRVRVDGLVQGVGFRPFVFRLAEELGLGGFVGNDERGVVLEVEGPAEAVEAFLERVRGEAPPLAHVERLIAEPVAPRGGAGFEIVASERGGPPDALVSPDTRDLPGLPRRAVGPRRPPLPLPVRQLHQLRAAVHDRARRPLRPAAHDDGRLPDVRRLPGGVRGPARPALPRAAQRLPGVRPAGRPDRDAPAGAADAVAAAAALLRAGAIVAVKGVGGYHLACRADDAGAVAALRARKQREDKPFALLVRDVAAARELVELDAVATELLCSPARPIVLAPRRAPERVAPAVAPGVGELGLALPYSPLHHLLSHDAGCALVLTSGNVSDEPIAYRDEDALERLAAHRRRLPRPRPPDPHAHRRLRRAQRARAAVAAAALARLRPGGRAAAGRGGAPAARVRGGAEEHVLRRARRARVGRPSHRRPRRTPRR